MGRKPVTILMPVRNGINFLPASLKGLVECCSSIDEIVIVDDKSTDGSRKVLDDWAMGQPNAKVYSNPGDGLVDALNFGISVSKHDWIARFDVDDIYDSNRIEKQIMLIEPSCVAVFSDYLNHSSDGNALGVIRTAIHPLYTELSIISGQRLAHPSVIYLKSAIEKAGLYRREDFPAEDLGLWFRLIRIGNFVSSPQPLLKYLITKNSITSLKQDQMRMQRDKIIQDGVPYLKELTKNLATNPLKIYLIYRDYENSRERRILCYRDIVIAGKLNVLPLHKVLAAYFGIFIEFLQPKSWWLIIRLQKEKISRQKYRFNQSSQSL